MSCETNDVNKVSVMGKIFGNPIFFTVLTVAIMYLGNVLGLYIALPISNLLSGGSVENKNPFAVTGFDSDTVLYLAFIGIWILFFLVTLIPYYRHLRKTVFYSKNGNTITSFIIGILVGFALNAGCILAAIVNKDIYLSKRGEPILALAVMFVFVLIQSGAEEILTRGFLFQLLYDKFGKAWVAIAGNALLFSLLHICNQGVTVMAVLNIFIIGIFFSIIRYYTKSLWCCIAIHTAWNYSQNIVFGLPNSGFVSAFSYLKLDASNARNSFFYNVGFGIEGTYFSFAIICVASLAAFLILKKRKAR